MIDLIRRSSASLIIRLLIMPLSNCPYTYPPPYLRSMDSALPIETHSHFREILMQCTDVVHCMLYIWIINLMLENDTSPCSRLSNWQRDRLKSKVKSHVNCRSMCATVATKVHSKGKAQIPIPCHYIYSIFLGLVVQLDVQLIECCRLVDLLWTRALAGYQ